MRFTNCTCIVRLNVSVLFGFRFALFLSSVMAKGQQRRWQEAMQLSHMKAAIKSSKAAKKIREMLENVLETNFSDFIVISVIFMISYCFLWCLIFVISVISFCDFFMISKKFISDLCKDFSLAWETD